MALGYDNASRLGMLLNQMNNRPPNMGGATGIANVLASGIQGGMRGYERGEDIQRNRIAQALQEQRINSDNNPKGEFGSLLQFVPEEQRAELAEQRARTLAKNPELLYDQSYASEMGRGAGKIPYAGKISEATEIGKKLANAQGEQAIAEAALPTSLKLSENAKPLLEKATYTKLGRLTDTVAREFGYTTEGAKARAELDSMIANEITPNLKRLLGGQFTEKQGEEVKNMLFNPNLSPDEKVVQLDDYIRTQKELVDQKRRITESYRNSSNQQIQEGMIIENDAGQRMILRGGQWQPM